MAKPLYYVEMYGSWRSMRPPVWQSFVEAMVAHIQHRIEAPIFEESGKPVYGKPSRVKVGEGPQGQKVYWAEEKHLFIRSPSNWKLEDWRFEMLEVARYCNPKEVPQGPDISSLLLAE